MRDKLPEILTVLILVILTALFLSYVTAKSEYRNDLYNAELEKVMVQLKQRNAEDCVLTKSGNVWRCKQFSDGQIFYVKVEDK